MTRLTLWDPFNFNQLNDLHSQLSRFVDEGMRASGFSSLPPVNISETDESVIVEFAVPGFKDDDVDVQVSKDSVTVNGEIKEESRKADKAKNVLRQEIRTHSFSRTIVLPTDVDPEKAEACFEDGILVITIKKAPETVKRKIKVTSAVQQGKARQP